jgi:hypothetical protein
VAEKLDEEDARRGDNREAVEQHNTGIETARRL